MKKVFKLSLVVPVAVLALGFVAFSAMAVDQSQNGSLKKDLKGDLQKKGQSAQPQTAQSTDDGTASDTTASTEGTTRRVVDRRGREQATGVAQASERGKWWWNNNNNSSNDEGNGEGEDEDEEPDMSLPEF